MMHPNDEAKFRAITDRSIPYSHKRKRCKCLRVVTEKQLKNYGVCAVCYIAAQTVVLSK